MTAIRLGPEDGVRYVLIRQRMLLDDWGNAPPPGAGIEHLQPHSAAPFLGDPRSATFAIESPDDRDELLAVATVVRKVHPHYAHRAVLLKVFVDPRHRGNGYGADVVEATIDCARSWPGVEYLDLCVNHDAVPARRLYERLGFVEWGVQHDAAEAYGRRLTEYHMTLKLRQ